MTYYLPPQEDVEKKIMELLAARGMPVQMTAIYRILAASYHLQRHERRGVKGDPKGSSWEYLVRQARKHLSDSGFVYSPQRGFWSLSEKGRKVGPPLSGLSIPASLDTRTSRGG